MWANRFLSRAFVHMTTVITPVSVPFQFIHLKIGGTTNGTHAALPHISRYGYDKKNIVLLVFGSFILYGVRQSFVYGGALAPFGHRYGICGFKSNGHVRTAI
jgi:hypothetical protein